MQNKTELSYRTSQDQLDTLTLAGILRILAWHVLFSTLFPGFCDA